MFNLPTTNCTFLHFTLHILQHQNGRVFNQANLHWHEFIFYIAHFKYSIPYSALHFAHPLASTTSEWGSVQSGRLTLGAKSGISHYWFTLSHSPRCTSLSNWNSRAGRLCNLWLFFIVIEFLATLVALHLIPVSKWVSGQSFKLA